MSMLSRRRDCLHTYGGIGSGGKVVIDFWICDKSLTPRRTQKSRRTHDSGRVVGYMEVILQLRSRSNRREPSRHLDD